MKIEIFGAEWCHFCKNAVELCKTNNLEYDYIDIDDGDNLSVLQERMGTKVRSIPQIFMNDVFVPNGYTGLKEELSKV